MEERVKNRPLLVETRNQIKKNKKKKDKNKNEIVRDKIITFSTRKGH
jgi:hypothetical protein